MRNAMALSRLRIPLFATESGRCGAETAAWTRIARFGTHGRMEDGITSVNGDVCGDRCRHNGSFRGSVIWAGCRRGDGGGALGNGRCWLCGVWRIRQDDHVDLLKSRLIVGLGTWYSLMRCHATTEMMQRHSAPPVVASLDIAILDIARLDVASLAVASFGTGSLGVASLNVASLDVAIASLNVASLDHANLGEEEGIGLGLGAIGAC